MLALGADERKAIAECRLTLSPDPEAWVETVEPDMPSAAGPPPEPPLAQPAFESDMLAARYFGDVRQYARLSVAEASRRPSSVPWTTPCTPSPPRRPSAPHPQCGRAPNGHPHARRRVCSRRTSASSLLSRSAIATAACRCWISFKKGILG